MKIKEIVAEAHHSRLTTAPIGKWNVHIDTHLFVTAAARDISTSTTSNIITYAFTMVPEIEKIPRGQGAFFQDTNTLISIYILRSKSYPNEFTVQTILSPEMKISPPLFRRPVPPAYWEDTPEMKAGAELIRQQVKAKGRDAVSQDLENMKPKIDARMKLSQRISDILDEVPPATNRAERRALLKYAQKRLRSGK